MPTIVLARHVRSAAVDVVHDRRPGGRPDRAGSPRLARPPQHRPPRRRVDPRSHRPATQLPHAHASVGPRAAHQDLSRREHRGRRDARRRSSSRAETDPPTAVIAFNDRSAVGLIFGLRRAGLSVPEHISVIGYDDIPMATLPFVDLTTVGQDATATARRPSRTSPDVSTATPRPEPRDLFRPTSLYAAPPPRRRRPRLRHSASVGRPADAPTVDEGWRSGRPARRRRGVRRRLAPGQVHGRRMAQVKRSTERRQRPIQPLPVLHDGTTDFR